MPLLKTASRSLRRQGARRAWGSKSLERGRAELGVRCRALDLDYARGRHTACARPFLIFPRGVSKGWSGLESSTPGERTESQQVTARS